MDVPVFVRLMLLADESVTLPAAPDPKLATLTESRELALPRTMFTDCELVAVLPLKSMTEPVANVTVGTGSTVPFCWKVSVPAVVPPEKVCRLPTLN